MAPPSGYTASQLIFDDQFCGTSLDATKWHPYMASKGSNGYPWNDNGAGGSGMGAGGYDSEYFEPSQDAVSFGLSISALHGLGGVWLQLDLGRRLHLRELRVHWRLPADRDAGAWR